MKKFRILSFCLALSLIACLFAGCTNRETPQQTEDISSIVSIPEEDALELLEGEDQEIEIDEGDVEDPFGA